MGRLGSTISARGRLASFDGSRGDISHLVRHIVPTPGAGWSEYMDRYRGTNSALRLTGQSTSIGRATMGAWLKSRSADLGTHQVLRSE